MELKKASSRKLCTYMFARCDRPFMFGLLDVIQPVDALRVSQGTQLKQRIERLRFRRSASATDDAITSS